LLLPSKILAQLKFQQSWYYTSVDTVSLKHINQRLFEHLTSAQHKLPFHNSGIYWFRLDIQNNHADEDLIIDIKNPHLDSVILYQYKNGKILATDTGGNDFKRKDNVFLRYVRFKVKGSTATVWLKARLKKEILFPVAVNTVTDFYKVENFSFLQLGFYYGIVAIVLLVNIVFFFVFREPKFLYYSILVLLVALLFAYADGLYVLISRNPIWLNYMNMPVQVGTAAASVVFSIKFLELDNGYIYLRWLSISLLILMAFCYLVYVAVGWAGVAIIGNIIGPLLFGLYWFVALFKYKEDVSARFFVFAYGLSLLFAVDFFLFRNLGLNFLNLLPGAFKFTNILQMSILSAGIILRARKLQQEHAYYREEIQRYLKGQPADRSQKKEISLRNDVFIQLQKQFDLSEREIDVLRLLAKGLTNLQIGETLYLSSNTVKFHIRNIYMKMEINNRTQAVNKIHQISS